MSVRGYTLNPTTTLVVEECCNCGIVFAMPQDFKHACLSKRGVTGKTFYCPNGHAQHYTGESDRDRADRIAGEKLRLESQLEFERKQARTARTTAKRERTRRVNIERRAHNGTCPYCSRTFIRMQSHITKKHPGCEMPKLEETQG